MMRTPIGEILLETAGKAEFEAVLIAPFIKGDALKRIVDNLSADVSLVVFARWIPEEIVAGVCDLEIFDILNMRRDSALFVHPNLHAKSYRFDKTVFIGSANLTNKALGWATPSNIEILTTDRSEDSIILSLERHLRKTAILVDCAYKTEIEKLVEELKAQGSVDPISFKAYLPTNNSSWLPHCREPKRLWSVYSDPRESRRRIVESAYWAACEDIWVLGIDEGLNYPEFVKAVSESLKSLTVVSEISEGAVYGISEDEAVKLLSNHVFSTASAREQWEILREWLLEFFPNTYRHETGSGIFRVAKIVG